MNPIPHPRSPAHADVATLAASVRGDPSRVGHAAVAALDRERLVALSAPAMEELHRQLDSPSITVMLADSAGGVLRAIGGGRGDAGALTPMALPADTGAAHVAYGADGDAGPAAPPRRAPVPPGQLGVAVPILPPAGALLGFIDAAAAPLEWLGHANALLHTTASIIEHRLIETEPRGFLLLRFHRYASVLGTPLEALVLFDADGAVLLANHAARAQLAPCTHAPGGPAACFATQWCGIVGYAALGLRQPFVLRDLRGTGFSAQASLCRQAT